MCFILLNSACRQEKVEKTAVVGDGVTGGCLETAEYMS